MHMLAILMTLAVRLMLVLLFLPFSALDKIVNFKGAVGQASQAVTSPAVARGLIVTGLFVEIVMSAGVITGFADRLAGFILAGYCCVTALLWKQFWRPGDFWARGASAGRDLFWDFFKNVALAGGFLLIAVGPNATAVRAFLDHPTLSSHPYAGGHAPKSEK